MTNKESKLFKAYNFNSVVIQNALPFTLDVVM